MKYRIYFEPIDLEGDLKDILNMGKRILADISKILPIDKDGFPIRQ